MTLWERGGRRRLIGVVHLLPLPGAPRPSPGLVAVCARAVADARALADGGVDAIIVENLGDAPFAADQVEPATVAAMTVVALAVRDACHATPLGVNVLRNDAVSALAVGAAVSAAFIRVNVLSGVMVTDQGVIGGRARELLLERNRLGADLRIAADVLVKHAVPLGEVDLADAARDLEGRAGADVIIVSGRGTGLPTEPARVRRVRGVVAAPVWIGSGVTSDAPGAAADADGAIVGTALHWDSRLDAPVDPERVRRMRAALDALPALTDHAPFNG